MSTSHRISDGHVELRLSGAFTPDEALGRLESALADPAYRIGMPILVDVREADATFPVAGVAQTAEGAAKLADRIVGRYAILVSNPLHESMAVLFTLKTSSELRTQVFTSREEALGWLRAGEESG